MASLGFDTFNVGPELEYFLFKDDSGTETLDEGGYFAMTTMDAASELRQETVRALETVGIPIEYVHHEVGPSQHEIDMRFAPALTMADHTVTYRLIVKEIAKKAGYHATFMPKPIFGENGSGMHTHQSLFSDGRNAFFDGDDRWHLSSAGKAFIAGQLRHARRDSLPRPRVQSLSDLRSPPPRGARGDRAGLRASRPDGDEPVPPDPRAAAGARHHLPARDARRGDRRAGPVRGGAEGARPAHLRPLRRAEAEGVGRVPGPALAVGARAV